MSNGERRRDDNPDHHATEDLFDDLREQAIVAGLAEGLPCYSDPCFAPAVPPDDLRADVVLPMTD